MVIVLVSGLTSGVVGLIEVLKRAGISLVYAVVTSYFLIMLYELYMEKRKSADGDNGVVARVQGDGGGGAEK